MAPYAEFVLPQTLLEDLQVEPDQRMRIALSRCPQDRSIHDVHLIHQLFRLNAVHSRHEYATAVRDTHARLQFFGEAIHGNTGESLAGRLVPSMAAMFHRAAASSKVLGTRRFLSAWAEYAIDTSGSPSRRSLGIDNLLDEVAGSPAGAGVSDMPELESFLLALTKPEFPDDDFQYILADDGSEIVFRSVSVVGDVLQASQSGVVLPRRTLLTHWREDFGLFASSEIEELEHLINDPKAPEAQFQLFFDRHPHFLRRDDYREVYSQVYLSHEDGPLVPDFILTDRELARAAIVELKLPRPKLIRRQHNRVRFAAAISEARAQLLLYRDWFRVPANRRRLAETIGMEIYEPNLFVIIGRSSEFLDAIDRQRLVANHPDIQIVTYDDIVTYASRRRMFLQ